MEELQLRFLEKQLTSFFNFRAKRPFFQKKRRHHQKKVIALNTYIGTNVLVYERWLVLKVRYMACWPTGPTLSPFHRLTLLMHASQIYISYWWFCAHPLNQTPVLVRMGWKWKQRGFNKAETSGREVNVVSFRFFCLSVYYINSLISSFI